MNHRTTWPAFLKQFIRFGLVGALNTGLTYLLYTLLLRAHAAAWAAWVLGYAAGMVCSLTLNARWTFRQKTALAPGQILRFAAVNLAALALSTGLIHVLTLRGVNEDLAGILAIPVSVLVNFAGNRLFVFHPPAPAEGAEGLDGLPKPKEPKQE
jgi:putative flippase GtrA